MSTLPINDTTIIPDEGSDAPNDFIMVGDSAWIQTELVLLYIRKYPNGNIEVEAYESSKDNPTSLDVMLGSLSIFCPLED